MAIQEELNTYKGVHRIVRYAFEYARTSGRSRVCMADKSNVMQDGHALWQRVFREVAADYPGIEPRHLYIDALALLMVQNPSEFEVIVTNNLFGDIITDLGAALQGGLGVAASGNLHPGRTSMFEPVHGSAPPLAGKNLANPMGAILSAALMLEYLGLPEEARRDRSRRASRPCPAVRGRLISAACSARAKRGTTLRRDLGNMHEARRSSHDRAHCSHLKQSSEPCEPADCGRGRRCRVARESRLAFVKMQIKTVGVWVAA